MPTSLKILKKKYSNCKQCPELVKNRSSVVFGSKHMNACKVLIIGEAPGKKEDESEIPFVGRSGEILNGFLKEIGLTREDVFITNTILCRPPGNRNPKVLELKNCKTRLNECIKLVNPEVVITLGNFSTQYLLETKEGITKLRGKIYEKEGYKILPMLHPANLLYNGMSEKLIKQFRSDFKKVKKLI
ncbi:uracil-DNA glycosylase [Candidatus Woesearchaeota archaeon]|jgi:DNA polymerase|nr:uracil-DNA glycosylase [Candidatus Woesearchaeota archaeon]MBT4058041.1 uracil-DNA glycosylase [Candidatus Woesearchaeota archaeon]MBT4207124.1 uracil-DNA glycosylase [Candidatus Woesearchaeota archaeon]MBT4731342.1 uracil-DNA glycosylase [Candidatus Woesearchaeota archaeon]MBT4783337.1 uracil-DNA glycosylase [Candidatus Woesearchaeota archaeon]